MRFNGLTNQGKAYLAKIQANQSAIKFKKIVIGDGRLDEHDNPLELKTLINKKFEKGIISKEQKGDIVTLLTYVDNVSLSQGYYPREIGVYVDDNGVEVLYYYMNDGDETSWVPPESYGPFKIELKLNIIASNSDSIIVNNLAKEMYVSKDYVDTQLKKKEDVISKGSAFNKNYGITKGTTLEGDKYSVMEGIAGDKINPGFIQDSGEKKENKFYLDKNTGRLYRCLKTTQSTTNSTDFFRDVSLANI
ncbi:MULTISPECIES: phage tail protein, partial [unclassified Fusobacterium]|uniref:phage tail-collar fiber domain-containing protein n=1 Tax=unclassified Fusobacterium TaxID=2648384 RepID=UPI001B8B1F3E